jgi:hypothetical protein
VTFVVRNRGFAHRYLVAIVADFDLRVCREGHASHGKHAYHHHCSDHQRYSAHLFFLLTLIEERVLAVYPRP